jgi:pimeloyl-ACP methyl ester carboxylesterase
LENLFLTIHDPSGPRELAYSEVGPANAQDLLLCIPGILETKATFTPLLKRVVSQRLNVRAISVDLCGRGASQPLGSSKDYNMATYLSDLVVLVKTLIAQSTHPDPRLHVLGTSMGGLLGMYLTDVPGISVSDLTLNDVGLSLSWWSIYKLFGVMAQSSIKEPKRSFIASLTEPLTQASFDINELATQLQVSAEVIKAVQSPSHFNLPYQSDLIGMRFTDVVSDFQGRVRLIHASDSVICTQLQVSEFLRRYPAADLCVVKGAGHPAPYDDQVCEFVLSHFERVHKSSESERVNLSLNGQQSAPFQQAEPISESQTHSTVSKSHDPLDPFASPHIDTRTEDSALALAKLTHEPQPDLEVLGQMGGGKSSPPITGEVATVSSEGLVNQFKGVLMKFFKPGKR